MLPKISLSNTFTVNVTPGLDMLRATIIVRTLLSVESVVVAEANQECADGKSVLDLCRLAAVCGTEIKFSATGPDAGRAMNAVEDLFATRFQALPRLGAWHQNCSQLSTGREQRLQTQQVKETTVMMKTDIQLKQDVEDELAWDPKVNAARIGVSVQKGAVSLTGEVDTYAEKWAAEDAAKRVSGVRSVAEDLTVKILGYHKHSDAEIAQAAASALKWHVWIPDTVKATVHEGQVDLEGPVEWKYQSDSAEEAVRHLTGVTGVNNLITVRPHASAAQVKEKVEAALQRQAAEDAKSIHVSTSGATVTLSGDASSWKTADDAVAAAWAAPGVNDVVDKLRVMPA